MKTVRFTAVILAVFFLVSLLVGCSDEENKKVHVFKEYTDMQLYSQGYIHEFFGYYPDPMSGFNGNNKFNSFETFSTKIGDSVYIDFYGVKGDFICNEVEVSRLYQGKKLCLDYVDDNKHGYRAEVNSETGQIMRFYGESDPNIRIDNGLDGGATEEEFMAYANSVIAQYMDTSDSRIILKTYIYEYSEEYGRHVVSEIIDGYVNNYKENDEFRACYRLELFSSLDGIERIDRNFLMINSFGHVSIMDLERQDALYEPFRDVKIDVEQAKALVWEQMGSFIPEDAEVEYTPELIATNEGELWLKMSTTLTRGDDKCGFSYIMRVAAVGVNN